MKKLILTISILFIANWMYAIEIENRIITVTNTAELFLEPEEIELEITIEEQGSSQNLTKVEQLFWDKVGLFQIDKKHLELNNVNVMYYWYYWWKNRDSSKKTKKLVLKLNSKTNFLKLAQALNHEWVLDIQIIGVHHHQLEQHINEVQVKAMKGVKDKAKRLLESIDEEIGKVVSVVELGASEIQNNNMQVATDKGYSYGKLSRSDGYLSTIPEIRIYYSVKTKFEIK